MTFVNELLKERNYPVFDFYELNSAKIIEYISRSEPPDENKIQQRMLVLKEALKNSPDSLMRNPTDEQLRKTIISSSEAMGGRYLLGQDNAVIGTGFAQFAMEGHIDKNIRKLTLIAIKRHCFRCLLIVMMEKAAIREQRN